MENTSSQTQPVRFGSFELDLRAGELRKQGVKLKIQEQPFQILAMLLERPGQVVTREELRTRLWPSDTFVDFDHSLNKAINKLREALGDSADSPRFIETLPKRGYRIIGTVQRAENAPAWREAAEPRPKRLHLTLIWGGVAVAVAVLVGFNFAALREHLLGKGSMQRIQSLAVLPLQNLSNDPAQEYFSDGMTDALITDLAQIGSLKVISRTSMLHYKKTDKSLPEIARELNVDGIVEGTVQRSGDRVRISAQLIYGPSDKHLWARSYERELRDTLQLQVEVAQDIAAGISANLIGMSGRHGGASYALNVEAYDDYLKGRNYVRRLAREDVVKGADLLERSVQRDPNYAPAYAELSYAYQILAMLNHRPPGEVIPKAKAAAVKALALDENLADAHSLLGVIYGEYEWDWAAEERELKRAIEVDPNSSFAHERYAVHLVTLKRKTDAIQEVNTALALDPFSPTQHSTASFVFRTARQYDSALREARRTVEIDPSYPVGHLNLAATLGTMGMYAEAFREWLRYLSLDGDGELAQELESAAKKLSVRGDPGQKLAHITISYYQKKSKTQYVAALTMAAAYIDLGDGDKMFEWLNKAHDEHSTGLYDIAVEPSLDPLHSDPRFQNLMRRMNFPP